MKAFSLLMTVALMTLSCGTIQKQSMIVVRDCTGTYLRDNSKDYHVCNVNSLIDFEEGDEVTAKFKLISTCKEGPDFVCELYHKNEGWVEVEKVIE